MNKAETDFDIVVIGGGHAGVEACLASARMGKKTALVTIDWRRIAQMSCNPAIGGLAKGHLVREIDALGGEMGHAIDAAGIQFRVLNRRKGPAVWSSRAQADAFLYARTMQEILKDQENLTIVQGLAEDFLSKKGTICGVRLSDGKNITSKKCILTAGTFLRGLIHIGLEHRPAGRVGDMAAKKLSQSLERLGIRLGRLKTGTPARLDGRTLDFGAMELQDGDPDPRPFSYDTKELPQEQVPCHITHTNEQAHDFIRSGLDRSPLYTGVIQGVGARYCPSIEDKVVRFPERERHQIFMEPEGRYSRIYYPNGISTSLPQDVQEKMIHSIRGLERAKIIRPGYAIEYDFADPRQLLPSLELKTVPGLYFAGQINGTSGYEEAAGQGLMAGINAALSLDERPPLVLKRSEAYIGVMIDDLVTIGTNEPYRMFTSRAEYRLLLREDNADLRLTEKGRDAGLVQDDRWKRFQIRKKLIQKVLKDLPKVRAKASDETNAVLKKAGSNLISETTSALQLLKRPNIEFQDLIDLGIVDKNIPQDVAQHVEIQLKYEGYINRQLKQVKRQAGLEETTIPPGLQYVGMPGLSGELRQKLTDVKPITVGQASRIPGMTPAAIGVLMIRIKQMKSATRRNAG